MNNKINYEKMEEAKIFTINKAEEYIYNNIQKSSAKQIDEIVKHVSKLYDI